MQPELDLLEIELRQSEEQCELAALLTEGATLLNACISTLSSTKPEKETADLLSVKALETMNYNLGVLSSKCQDWRKSVKAVKSTANLLTQKKEKIANTEAKSSSPAGEVSHKDFII